jgi:hypothetical protein
MMLLSLNEQMSEDVTQRKIADMTRTLSTFFKLSTELFGSKIAIDLVKMIEVNLLGYPIFHIYMEPFPHRMHDEQDQNNGMLYDNCSNVQHVDC